MKKLSGLTIILLTVATVACDNPQRNRLASTVSGNGLSTTNSTTSWTTATTTTSGTTSGTTTTATTTRPAGFETCDITAKYYAAGLNYLGICQSTLDETSIAVNTTVAESTRTCIIPTYKDSTGSSTYLGQPQCFAPTVGTVQGNLYKTRTGFTGYAINGAMIMKESSLTAYYACMNALATFTHPYCPSGAQTNASCLAMANAVMATTCNNFKASYPYIDVRLKN